MRFAPSPPDWSTGQPTRCPTSSAPGSAAPPSTCSSPGHAPTHPFTGRIKDIAADAWMPHVLLINDPSPQDITALQALDSDLADTGRCAVAVAVITSTPIGRWPVTVDTDGNMSIGFLGMSDQEAI